MAKEKPKDPPTLPQRMKRMAANGHPDAADLFAAADAYENASNKFWADRERSNAAYELARQGIETPEVTNLLALNHEAHRVLLTALTPKPGTVADWTPSYE